MPRKRNKPVPLVVLDEAHRALEEFPELKGMSDYKKMVAILKDLSDGYNVQTLYFESFQIVFGTAWEQAGKQIFDFDIELSHALAHQTDLAVATDTLKRLPFKCGYIRLPKTLRYGDKKIDGFFARLHDSEIELLVCGTGGEWFGRAPVKLSAKTFAESWAMTEKLPGLPVNEPLERINDAGLSVMIQALLYLCAQNADLARTSPAPSTAGRQTRNNAKQAKKLPVQSWSVGVRVGQAIKANRRRYEHTGTGTQRGTHARPRPHLRSGHWSHYWVGKGRTEKVLRWIEPRYINADSPDELPAVIRKVEK